MHGFHRDHSLLSGADTGPRLSEMRVRFTGPSDTKVVGKIVSNDLHHNNDRLQLMVNVRSDW